MVVLCGNSILLFTYQLYRFIYIYIIYTEEYSQHACDRITKSRNLMKYCRVSAKEPARVWFWSWSFYIPPMTETLGILRIFIICEAELPSKTGEKTDFGLAQFVILKNNCLLVHTPRGRPNTRRTSKHTAASRLTPDTHVQPCQINCSTGRP